MDAAGNADVFVQLIAPEELPVCDCKHHHDAQKKLAAPSGNAGATTPFQKLVTSWKAPYFILLISVLEVLMWMSAGEETTNLLVYDPHHREQIWRFLTYMLLHGDELHLLLNILIQVLLAAPLEHEQGHLRTGCIYFGGVLAGSLGNSVLEPELYMMGASGGVYALLISHLANIMLNFNTVPYKLQRASAVAVLALADVASTLYHYFTGGNKCPRISWAAHSSGATAGFLLGLLLFRGDSKPGLAGIPCTRVAIWVAAILLGAFLTATITCNILLPPPPRSAD